MIATTVYDTEISYTSIAILFEWKSPPPPPPPIPGHYYYKEELIERSIKLERIQQTRAKKFTD